MLSIKDITSIGIYAPKEHQRIISQLNTGLGYLYYVEGKITLEPLPETMIDEGANKSRTRFALIRQFAWSNTYHHRNMPHNRL